ncbi:MAG: ABC transporter permease [Thermotoga caldifontis]|uniref:ABC transporter permease n=1 Tax=Thermotoga caldifontis TaxID=1508419 RepID=UPI003C7D4E60
MRRRKELMVGFLLILPALTVLVTLYVYPLVLSIYMSFVAQGRFSLANYLKVFEIYWRDIIYSVAISLVATAVTLGLSIGVSGYLRFKSWKFLEIMYKLPLFIPFLIVGHAMRVFLAPHGTLNNLLTRILRIEELPGLSRSWIGLVWAFVWVMTPYAALIVLGAFRSLDNAYIEAARNLGASRWKIVFDVLIPMCRPSIMVAFILTFVRTISSLTIPIMVGPASPNMITVNMMFRVNYFNDWGTANALGVISYLIVMVFAIYYLKFMAAERGGIKA